MTKEKRLALVLLLNGGMVVALAIVGVAAHSLGVLAAGGDYLGDATGVAVSLVALRIGRVGRGDANATTHAALVNAVLLLIVTLLVIADAVHRLLAGAPHVHGLPVVIVSVVAGLMMAACALVIGTVEEGDLNMRSVMLDTLADGVSAAGVAISGAVILASKGTYWLDPAVALGIATIIAYHASCLIKDVLIALQNRASHGGHS